MNTIEKSYTTEENEVDQILGKALGYPPYPNKDSDWVCTGDHTIVTLAMEAARN